MVETKRQLTPEKQGRQLSPVEMQIYYAFELMTPEDGTLAPSDTELNKRLARLLPREVFEGETYVDPKTGKESLEPIDEATYFRTFAERAERTFSPPSSDGELPQFRSREATRVLWNGFADFAADATSRLRKMYDGHEYVDADIIQYRVTQAAMAGLGGALSEKGTLPRSQRDTFTMQVSDMLEERQSPLPGNVIPLTPGVETRVYEQAAD